MLTHYFYDSKLQMITDNMDDRKEAYTIPDSVDGEQVLGGGRQLGHRPQFGDEVAVLEFQINPHPQQLLHKATIMSHR